jgi:hypothetical protein
VCYEPKLNPILWFFFSIFEISKCITWCFHIWWPFDKPRIILWIVACMKGTRNAFLALCLSFIKCLLICL